MRRTEQVQGLRLMKFEEVYGRTHRGGLSQAEAAEVLGVSERTFRRWRDRYEAEGADGLYDRRLGRLSARRAPVDEVARVLELFDTRYWDFTAKHFHEKLVADHGFKRSYNWLRLSLQAHGRRRAAPRRGAHRRKRPRRALPGMMLHQDGSSHEWVPGRWWDLIVTMDDATSDIYSAFFVAEEGTMSSFQGVSEAIWAKGLFCSLYGPRQPLLEHARGRRQGGQGHPDPGRPRPGAARHRVDPGLLARGKGALGAHFGTLQKRLPQELRLAGITDMVEANRFLKEVFTTQRPLRPRPRTGAPPSSPSPARSRHPVHPRGTHRLQILSTTRCAPGTSDPRRPFAGHYEGGSRPRIPRTMAVLPWTAVWRARQPNRRPRDQLRRDRPAPCGRGGCDRPLGQRINSYGVNSDMFPPLPCRYGLCSCPVLRLQPHAGTDGDKD